MPKNVLVTGATRGAGLAIAQELAAAGHRVVVTGRTTRAAPNREGLPGTIEDAASLVGGRGIRCDHTNEADVRALAAQVGPLDALVLNAWGGYEDHDAGFAAPFWEHDFEKRWRGMFEGGLRAQLLTAHHLAPRVADGGLIVSTIASDEGKYLGAAYYDITKAAIARAAFAWSRDLRPRRVTAIALAPGFMRTERVMAAHQAAPFDLSQTESPHYLGRAVAALVDASVERQAWNGRVAYVADLARQYGFTDLDGSQPPRFVLPEL